jgi:predicted nuclease of predicted toxin-antitoxin system
MKTDKPNPPKLLLDEQIWERLAMLLRQQGFDVIHVYEAGLDQTPDPEILRSAVENHRAVVTFIPSISFRLPINTPQKVKCITVLSSPTKFRREN